MSIDLYSDRYIRDMVAHLPGVIGAVYTNAKTIKVEAEQRLAMHRYYKDDNAAEIELDRGEVDSFVSLVDTGAVPIEFGYRTSKGTHVPGLYIVTGAAGLA
jgi:UDP-N-acetylenolpyruvoylglucosamine reductase